MGQSLSTPPLSITQTPILAIPATATLSTSTTPQTTPSDLQKATTNPLRRALAAPAPPLDQATRFRRQAGTFFGGATFVVVAALITRRSLTRRNRILPTLTPTPAGVPIAGGVASKSTTVAKAQAAGAARGAAATTTTEAAAGAEALALENAGPILAVEALMLATLNVVAWAVMATGGVLWYFDVASMDEMRRKVRGGMGVDGSGRTEEEAEEEMEEWLATVLARKEGKEESRAREAVEAREGTRGGKWRVRD